MSANWITPKEAAFIAKVKGTTLTNWTHRGYLHPKRINQRVIFYDESEVLAAMLLPPRIRGKDKGPRKKVFGAEKVTPVGMSMPIR